ncbi:MAG: amidohydrolase family protein [Pseudoxanthomonas sp.]
MTAPIIDLHSHWFSPAALALLEARHYGPRIGRDAHGRPALHRAGAGVAQPPFPLGPQWFDIEARLAHLDAVGVVHQLLSWPTTLGVDPGLDAAATLPLWTCWNEQTGALVRQYPRRFSALAALSTADVAWSARELARAHDTLGLIGGTLPVAGLASLTAAQHFAPLFKVAQRHRSHIYLHTGFAHPSVPGQPLQLLHADTADLRGALDTAQQFASALLTLGFTDFLDAYPDVTVQVAMLGGSGLFAPLFEQFALHPVRAETVAQARRRLRRVWLDTGAAGQGPAAIAAVVRVLGADRVVFGSDYAPAANIAAVAANVRAAGLQPAQQRAVFHDNAAALLRGHGVPLAPAA